MNEEYILSRHDEACEWCGSLPGESHSIHCPEQDEIDADDVQFCDGCGQSYVTECGCESEVR